MVKGFKTSESAGLRPIDAGEEQHQGTNAKRSGQVRRGKRASRDLRGKKNRMIEKIPPVT